MDNLIDKENLNISAESSICLDSNSIDLIAKVEPVVKHMGYELLTIDLNSRSGIVRIYLLSKSGFKTPITLQDCESVHRQISPMFDVWDPIDNKYTLEVSSPGEKPKLRLLSHFAELIGENITFKTVAPVSMPEPAKPRKNWKAKLVKASSSDNSITVSDEGSNYKIELDNISSACWEREWK